jgi:hypothetical protein
MGEFTAKMAEAVTSSAAPKLLLPLNRQNIRIIGSEVDEPLPHQADLLIKKIEELWTTAYKEGK